MRTVECYLDDTNTMNIGEHTVSEALRAAGTAHLWSERGNTVVDTVVIHSMNAGLVNKNNPFERASVVGLFVRYGVSSHYCVERDGMVLALVPEEWKAWHCGGSIMPPPDLRTSVNAFSIGIELLATEQSGFTEPQYASCLRLCRELELRNRAIRTYVGHEHIAREEAVHRGLRSEIKTDPGVYFPWERFRNDLQEGSTVGSSDSTSGVRRLFPCGNIPRPFF